MQSVFRTMTRFSDLPVSGPSVISNPACVPCVNQHPDNCILHCCLQAHFELQKATLQFEKANSRHVYARQRVHEAENRVFGSGEKRAFDTALQEMLNQATLEVKTVFIAKHANQNSCKYF